MTEEENNRPPTIVYELVERFREHREAYRSPNSGYNETQLRREFLDPLFAALGWDIGNEAGLSATYKEVVHEDALKIEGKRKAPDYCFRVGGMRQFFLEAKKPAVNINESTAAAYQLRRYAWSAKLPFSILSDFEEFAIYDCRPKPSKTDGPETARLLYFTFDDLEQRWDKLASMFSREAVSSGALHEYAKAWKPIKAGAEVDRAFLLEIERWREALAKDLAKSNRDLSQSEINFSVQRTIDRIVFLRICEDRGLEDYGTIEKCASTDDVYKSLLELFHRADERYDSGLFHFKVEESREETEDRLTPAISIHNHTLRGIIKKLYYPDSPYEFSVLPADILGQVYEQFLGRVIHLGPSGKAIVEDKPEVRKAGGVYYTPTFVVDYIVSKTVGGKVRGVDPRKIGGLTEKYHPSQARDARPLRIVDPACGSGSFLLGAYEYLLNWYLSAYVENDPSTHASGKSPRLYAHPTGEWRLTTREKKRILLTHIYGVDIDPQAVETTQLSLLLKVLEGEQAETIGSNLRLFQERALPDLAGNIKCGNSLVDPSDGGTSSLAEWSNEFAVRANVFDWRQEFPNVFSQGGFDVVIGNPPYRRERDFKNLLDEIACTEFGRAYRSARMDLWYYFVHKGLHLLRTEGQLAYITNAYWLNGTGSGKLISHIQTSAHIEEILYLDKLKVFRGVSGSHMITRLMKTTGKWTLIRRVPDSPVGSAQEYIEGKRPIIEFYKNRSALFHDGKLDIEPPREALLKKLNRGKSLSNFGIVRQGIAENPASINKRTNKKYGERWMVGEGVFALTPEEVQQLRLPKKEGRLLRDYHDLCDIGRYYVASDPSLRLIYTTRDTCPDINKFPVIRRHLQRFRPVMENRRETREGKVKWWHLHWPRDEEIWRADKILCVQMGKRPKFARSAKPCYVGFSVNVFVPTQSVGPDLNYILAVLNSRLLWVWFKHNAKRRGVGIEINGNVLRRAPIVVPDLQSRKGKELHDGVSALAKSVTQLVQDQQAARTPHGQRNIRRQIAAREKQIDDRIFQIYDVSSEEMLMVLAETEE